MRTLTNVELGFVSGGESPCYALKGNAGCSPSTPGMSAGQISNAAQAASLSLQAKAAQGGKGAKWYTIGALAMDAVAFIADSVGG